MDTLKLKNIVRECFTYMLVNDYCKEQTKMISTFKSIILVLKTQYNLSEIEMDNCVVYFCNEYNLGTSKPMSDFYIKATIIPLFREFEVYKEDFIEASSILFVIKSQHEDKFK